MISIIIEDNGAVSLKTTKGVVETEMAATIVVEVMRNLFKPKDNESNKTENDIQAQTNYYLYLNKIENNNRLSIAKELSSQLNISLERAKVIICESDYNKGILLSQSFDKSFINNMKAALESKGCVCEITSN